MRSALSLPAIAREAALLLAVPKARRVVGAERLSCWSKGTPPVQQCILVVDVRIPEGPAGNALAACTCIASARVACCLRVSSPARVALLIGLVHVKLRAARRPTRTRTLMPFPSSCQNTHLRPVPTQQQLECSQLTLPPDIAPSTLGNRHLAIRSSAAPSR